MSKRITRMRLGEPLDEERIDWARIDAMRDEDIDTSDIPPPDEGFLRNAKVVMPPGKKKLILRLDADAMHWLKDQGMVSQSRINTVLRAYYGVHRN